MQSPTLNHYLQRTQSQSGSAMLKQSKILVVESDPDSIALYQILFEQYYATVLTANCASQALMIATCTYPDVVISNLRLPGEDGYALIQKIHQLRTLRSAEELDPCFAIAIDTDMTSESRERAFSAGYQAYLTKPFKLNDLLLRVEIVANRMICHLWASSA